MRVAQLNSEAGTQASAFKTWILLPLMLVPLALIWWASDLWRLMTWPRHQLEMDDALPRRQLAELALFGFAVVLVAAVTTIVASVNDWHLIEWAIWMFVLGFLYSVASFIRLVR